MQVGGPEPDGELLAALRQALLEVGQGAPVEAEWSQAGTQHSGRAYLITDTGPQRIGLPDAAVAAFAALRTQMTAPGIGAWLSARVRVAADEDTSFQPNYHQRPAWNSPTTSMLDEPQEPRVPDEHRWLVDLRRHPRDRAHIPTWLAPDAVEGEAAAELRTALDGAGVARAAVVLPGDNPAHAFEGHLEVVRYSPAHFALRVTDYGQHHLLGEYRSEREACLGLWQYLMAPMPQPIRVPQAELAARAQGAQRAYQDLHGRLLNVGLGGLITNLAVGVPYDRFGGVDGLYFFGWGTPWEQRSLPPGANAPGAQIVSFVALRAVEVQAEIVPPWFGQPGGGIRFHVEGGRAMRDLVREQALAVVQVDR
ncbi:TNT domain-containing protein [Pseudactinotalea sp.]|uniref:TNT domain-containing protein n=1 Tax=Pseudactinotalea sp. TaxID=1926260 RepID=UPI003B3B333E